MQLLAMLFAPLILSLFSSNILITLLSHTRSLYLYLQVTQQVKHPHKTSGVFYFNLYVLGLELPSEVTIPL
jgi:hypothetical protein